MHKCMTPFTQTHFISPMDGDADGGWDLHAVVRGRVAPPAPTNPSLSLADQFNSFNFLNEQNNNYYGVNTNNNGTFQDLQDAYKEFYPSMPLSAVDFPGDTSAISFPGGNNAFQPSQDIMRILRSSPPAVAQMNNNNVPGQENIQFNNSNPSRIGSSSSSNNLQLATIPQPNRQRRRKNQQVKVVCQMTQEEFSADSWAWRKYGQKPIKGSPYPRNYYRCNTSKGCAARRQVERSSNIDPSLFVVTYTGEHTHSRPTNHRSSPAGSTRGIPSTAAGTSNRHLSYSPSAGYFPGTPLEAAEEEEDYENAFLISNQDDGDDDMFKRYRGFDHDHSSGGGGFAANNGGGWQL